MSNKLSILFADDESNIRLSMNKLLNIKFDTVYIAKDGEEAFLIYRNMKPDILILDNLMPKQTGLNIIKKIREIDTTTKIILLTAHKDEEYLLDAIPLHLSAYVVKPLHPMNFSELLDDTIKELINKNKIYFQNDFMFNKSNNILYHNDNIVKLTKIETKLISILIERLDNNIEYDIIANSIWDDKELSNYINSLRSCVNKIHKKINNEIISSTYGYGYRIKK